MTDLDPGTPGGSARREHERRLSNREQRVRERHPHIGGLLLALQDAPRHEEVWARGAGGEETVARALAERCTDDVVLLHDRRIPGTRTNIDHVAVAPSGVWVIDSKRYKGKVAVRKPWFGEAKLTIAGRDRTKLVHGLAKQVELVRAVVADLPVHGALCFVDAQLPLLGPTMFDGFSLLYPRQLAKRLNGTGPLTGERVHAAAALIAERFTPAA
jgi:hypothetical protein